MENHSPPDRATGHRVRGYVPGVFDMFHVGHLNVIQNARAHCDELIVGVVTDEVVASVKGRPPVVPLAERMEVVGAIRGVDRVLTDAHRDKFDSWREVRFDVIFKGDDWAGTPKGERLEQDLAAVGARVHYFPYTRHTSSTLLRQALDLLVNGPEEVYADLVSRDELPSQQGQVLAPADSREVAPAANLKIY